jgi:hypothetical protein
VYKSSEVNKGGTMKVEIKYDCIDMGIPCGYFVHFKLGWQPQRLGPYGTKDDAKEGFKKFMYRIHRDFKSITLWKTDVIGDEYIEWECTNDQK